MALKMLNLVATAHDAILNHPSTYTDYQDTISLILPTYLPSKPLVPHFCSKQKCKPFNWLQVKGIQRLSTHCPRNPIFLWKPEISPGILFCVLDIRTMPQFDYFPKYIHVTLSELGCFWTRLSKHMKLPLKT